MTSLQIYKSAKMQMTTHNDGGRGTRLDSEFSSGLNHRLILAKTVWSITCWNCSLTSFVQSKQLLIFRTKAQVPCPHQWCYFFVLSVFGQFAFGFSCYHERTVVIFTHRKYTSHFFRQKKESQKMMLTLFWKKWHHAAPIFFRDSIIE